MASARRRGGWGCGSLKIEKARLAWGRWGREPSAPVTGDQLPDSRHQLRGDLYDRLGPVFEGGFILGYRLGLRLLFIVSQNPEDPLFVPALRKSVLLHFLLLRRR
jgi:hypothetical protein